MRHIRGFVSLIGILLTITIIAALLFVMLKIYFGVGLGQPETSKALKEQGIDTSSYKSTIDSARKRIKDISRQYQNRAK